MVRNEVWKQQYRDSRYMQYLSAIELEERAKDILTNILLLSGKGQISLHPIDGIGEYWMILFTHIIEEFQQRYGPYPNGFTTGFIKDATIIKPSYPEQPKAKEIIDKIGGIKSNNIYKFGKAVHLNEMFARGRIRIAPASLYSDPSLNKAIRDDELSVTIKSRADRITVKHNNIKIPIMGNVEFRLQAQTNYFVHCFASNYTFREFDDFEADTCIIIREPVTLIEKMMSDVKQIKPDYVSFSSGVNYIDPLNVNPNEVNIFFTKHFRYSYQNEYRIIWVPNVPTMNLEAFYIEIGDMKDYAELIHL